MCVIFVRTVARVALATTDGRRHSIRPIDPPGGWSSPLSSPIDEGGEMDPSREDPALNSRVTSRGFRTIWLTVCFLDHCTENRSVPGFMMVDTGGCDPVKRIQSERWFNHWIFDPDEKWKCMQNVNLGSFEGKLKRLLRFSFFLHFLFP